MEITKENCKDYIKNMKEIKYFSYSDNYRFPQPNRYLSCYSRTYFPLEIKRPLNVSEELFNVYSLEDFMELKKGFKNDFLFIQYCESDKIIVKTNTKEICNFLKIPFRVHRNPEWWTEVYIIFNNRIGHCCYSIEDETRLYIPYVELMHEDGSLKYDTEESNMLVFIVEIIARCFNNYEMVESVSLKGLFYHKMSQNDFDNMIANHGKSGKFVHLKNENGMEDDYFIFNQKKKT